MTLKRKEIEAFAEATFDLEIENPGRARSALPFPPPTALVPAPTPSIYRVFASMVVVRFGPLDGHPAERTQTGRPLAVRR